MSRKVGQIIARGERRWLVRVYLGRDRETRKRTYHNRTIYGSLRYAQAYLTRKLHERDLSRGVEGLQVTVDEFLDYWLRTAVKPKVRDKTFRDYAAMLRRYIRPAIGTRILASLSPLEIQAAYHPVVDPEERPEAVDLIFVTEFGRPVNVNSLVYKHFKPILKRARLPNIRLYDLRHTAATLALTVGVSPKVVSEQLGHTSAAFTLDVYSHVLPHMQDDAAAKVEAVLMG